MAHHAYQQPITAMAFNHSSDVLAISSGTAVALVRGSKGLGVLKGRPSAGEFVSSVCLNDDGSLLACGADDMVWLFDARTHKRLATLRAGGGVVHSVSFNRDGSVIASGNHDGSIRLWSTVARKCIATQMHGNQGRECAVTSVLFSPDGSTLGSLGWGAGLKLWDSEAQRCLATLEGTGGVCFSADGRTIASGCVNGSVKLWDVRTRECAGEMQRHDFVSSVSFGQDGILASGGGQQLKLWDLRLQSRCLATYEKRMNVGNVCFSPDGSTLAYSTEMHAYVWPLGASLFKVIW